jgi:hypothetical protein
MPMQYAFNSTTNGRKGIDMRIKNPTLISEEYRGYQKVYEVDVEGKKS